MLWSDVLNDWQNGIVQKYPENIKNRFQWNTSVLKDDGNVPFKQSFKVDYRLPQDQDMRPYQEYIKKSKNKYVVAFLNLTKDIILVVPMPIVKKNYATLKDFIDNAPIIQQQKFWKKVAKIAIKLMKEKDKVWISVHGLGVAYTHVRLSTSPTYYFDKELAIG
jgi:hypothetical protein